MRLQKGNRKLPKETLIWNLPSQLSCPHSTPECRQHCYAKKAEKLYPQVKPFRDKNFKIAKDGTFFDTIDDELGRIRNWKQVRIHESGDFFNQKYFDRWNLLARINSFKIFYAYTKNHTLNFWDKAKNMIIILSDDNNKFTNKELKDKGFDGRAKVVEKDYKVKKNEFLCQGDCKVCNYCYVKTKSLKQVVFIKH